MISQLNENITPNSALYFLILNIELNIIKIKIKIYKNFCKCSATCSFNSFKSGIILSNSLRVPSIVVSINDLNEILFQLNIVKFL